MRLRDAKGPVIGEGNTQVNVYGLSVAAAVSLMVVGVLGLWWLNRGLDSSAHGKEGPPQANSVATTTAAEGVPGPSGETTTPAAPPIWYDLTTLKSIIWNNGFTPIDPVQIGANSYPAGIVGSYQSSATDPNNRAIWAISSKCTEFRAWVGKNTTSAGGGTGRFVVIGDGRELRSVELGPNDPATEIRVNITGVNQLTLMDTRRMTEASNAWGRPGVLCGSVPSPPR
ncbi:NPCBM/NEW2 domain-containing protein [Nocardia sp. NPDC005978]|uniref:NPCBM/NEW2 domain-containing protein n=1 Tax=Nocardia sp. NPDC005978 TaxID=3156725 RepID=UPI0033AB73DC